MRRGARNPQLVEFLRLALPEIGEVLPMKYHAGSLRASCSLKISICFQLADTRFFYKNNFSKPIVNIPITLKNQIIEHFSPVRSLLHLQGGPHGYFLPYLHLV